MDPKPARELGAPVCSPGGAVQACSLGWCKSPRSNKQMNTYIHTYTYIYMYICTYASIYYMYVCMYVGISIFSERSTVGPGFGFTGFFGFQG